MRELASRAQVSLRTPYQIFGSKGGVVRALLLRDQERWRARRRALPAGSILDRYFLVLSEGVAFYAENQAFYRALFRTTVSYAEGAEADPGRDKPERFRVFCENAIAGGVLEPAADPAVLGEALTDIFAANVRVWASSSYDVAFLEARVGYGWAMLLAAAARPQHVTELKARAEAYQRRLAGFVGPNREVLDGVLP